MQFLERVENSYFVVEAGVTPARKPSKLTSHKSNKKDVLPKASEGAEKVSFSELTNTRKLTSFIEKELQLTDPFNFTNETWTRFTKKVAPKLLTALLIDMNIVPRARKAEFARYLERRLRTLAKN